MLPETCRFGTQWVLSHIDIVGHEEAHKSAEESRLRHRAYEMEWVPKVREERGVRILQMRREESGVEYLASGR